jgi:glycosyltransferase involved in cell wall biosynthesis
MKISVVAFDLSDNATGRAELLARLLAPRYEVSVVGPQFGKRPWPPLEGSPVAHRGVPAGRYPRFLAAVPRLLRLVDGDVIYASKPRATSFGLALLARARRRRPLLLDVDDWELGFFYRSDAWGRLGRALNVSNPNGLPWTWLAERAVGRADAVTVASRFLERRFGGTLIPHVRDTDVWDPARHDRDAARARLGAGRRAVVMFLGTPRTYKGVDDLVDAVGLLRDRAVLALVGVRAGSEAARRWSAMPHVTVVEEVPFDDVPRYLAAADVVAVPQRATSDTVGQVPAKLFDAMAMARPIVATHVSMIPEVLEDCGLVVPPADVRALADGVRRLLDDRATAEALGRRARARCIAEYSFAAARARLYPLVERLVARGQGRGADGGRTRARRSSRTP